jgi:hypothetical protein
MTTGAAHTLILLPWRTVHVDGLRYIQRFQPPGLLCWSHAVASSVLST